MSSKHYVWVPMLIAALAAGCSAQGPEAVARAFYNHLEDGEIEAAIDLLSSQTVGQIPREKLRAGFREVALDIEKKGGIDELELVDQTVKGEIARLSMAVRYGNGSTENETVVLVREDGAWRIQPEK